MKTFTQWAEANKMDLPVLKDAEVETPADNDAEEPKKATAENTKRTGYSGNYPPAYKHGQYPDNYFSPSKATVPVDKQNIAKQKIVTPPDTAAK